MLDNTTVGNRIAFLRKQVSFTQEELAQKLGITAQAISKWENGHTLPETASLPLLANLFNCSIDSILLPFAARDSAFKSFVCDAFGKHGELAIKLYQKLKDNFNFTVTYNDKYYIFEAEHSGGSATFNIPDKEDFIIRIDVEAGVATDDNDFIVRIPLRNCSKYMNLIDKMPENIRRSFRLSDCKSCTCNCPYCMVYSFEGIEYKQCHFIAVSLDSADNMEHIFTLVCAEHEMFMSDKTRT